MRGQCSGTAASTRQRKARTGACGHPSDTQDMPPTPGTCPGQGDRCQVTERARDILQQSCVGAPARNGVTLPGLAPSPLPAPREVNRKQSTKDCTCHPPAPGHTRRHQASRVAATPYLHSVTLQQQLPLRRPQRLERSSGLDFLRLKYSVSFPNEAMAPAGVPASLCTLVHATPQLRPLPCALRQPSAPGGSGARRTQRRAGRVQPPPGTWTVHTVLQRALRSEGC